MTLLSFIPPPPLQRPFNPHHPPNRVDLAPLISQAPTYIFNTGDGSIAHNVAKMSFEQIFDLTLYFFM